MIAFALLAMVAYGLAAFILKIALGKIDWVTGAVSNILGGMLCVVMFYLWFLANRRGELVANGFWVIAFAAGLVGGIGLILHTLALKGGNLSIVEPIIAAQTVMPVLLGLVVLHEGITWVRAIAIVLIISGLVLIQ